MLDNKQAAVLVPTTILAEQHYNTFKDRLSPWAVEVEHLSRFKTKKEQVEILKKLEDGKINIIIGTHRLLSKDVKFKDLGLLVIDEEQRFGVKAKEKLKFMRENVDVLTLTATPIPRTLNFSLLGARDLSIINTPPKNRQPIHTEIINLDKKTIGNSIIRELQRGGQVYFVNDRIAKLEELAFMIEELVPFAKVAIAHGQMTSIQLEKVMMRFLEKKCNVLLCTKIIESGLDIPSVNTIIINRADNFGLAELYQLRGRVGRSNIKSYAYLITPPQSVLTKQAIRRLHALEEFSELGSGMNLALRDLEIRGAGNLLGKEQSGFISEMGFDMYMQILDEAVNELRESELAMALSDIIPKAPVDKKRIREVAIESDIAMLIPETYIDDENSRLEIYQRLSSVSTIDELNEIKAELIDRFGKFPDETESLFTHIKIKVICGTIGFSKISISANLLELHMNPDDELIFSSGYFEKLAQHISVLNNAQLVQSRTSLFVKFRLHIADHSMEKLGEVMKIIEKLENL
jgi:transcription-repair coupling factor (superfamily II helicase)